MISQIIAVFKDSYRLIKSGYLFWISFILTALFGLLFLSIGNDKNGVTLFFGGLSINAPLLAAGQPGFKLFYLGIFDQIIIGFVLTWIVPILGLISTSTLFPDFLKQGAVDVALSKPISRTRFFTLKYLGGLLFVLLQVGFFSIFIYLIMGFKLQKWDLYIFLIIPIVTLVFSYLYVVNVFFGVLFRTPILSLIITLLFWGCVAGIQQAELVLNQLKISSKVRLENIAEQGEEMAVQQQEVKKHYEQFKRFHAIAYYIHLAFPKIQETTDLAARYIAPDYEGFLMDMAAGKNQTQSKSYQQQKQIHTKIRDKYRSRSLWYVIGTSLLFELAVFALTCMLFSIRDY